MESVPFITKVERDDDYNYTVVFNFEDYIDAKLTFQVIGKNITNLQASFANKEFTELHLKKYIGKLYSFFLAMAKLAHNNKVRGKKTPYLLEF